MTVYKTRIIALAAVLVGVTALVPITRLHAQQPPDALPLEEARALAEQGNADAQLNLGGRYADGLGVSQDEAEAVRWFRLAAEQDDARGFGNVGRMYHQGRGVPQDDVEAHMWYTLCAARGGDAARDWLAKFFDDLEGRMTPEQIAEAQRRAREWKPTPEPSDSN